MTKSVAAVINLFLDSLAQVLAEPNLPKEAQSTLSNVQGELKKIRAISVPSDAYAQVASIGSQYSRLMTSLLYGQIETHPECRAIITRRTAELDKCLDAVRRTFPNSGAFSPIIRVVRDFFNVLDDVRQLQNPGAYRSGSTQFDSQWQAALDTPVVTPAPVAKAKDEPVKRTAQPSANATPIAPPPAAVKTSSRSRLWVWILLVIVVIAALGFVGTRNKDGDGQDSVKGV
jgi:hypothetical protein